MYVKCQTACVVWCSLTRNLLPLVTAFHGKNCFGTCLGYHYLHRQKCKIEPENDAFQQGISFTTGGAFSGSMQVPCWFLQGCSPDVFPKKNGTIFDDLCKTSASFLHTVAQWHGRLTRRPPGSIFPTDVFSGSKVLERERESLLEQYLPGKQPLLLFPSTLPLKAANQVSFEKRWYICFTGRQIVLHNAVEVFEPKTHKSICCFGWINQLPCRVGRLSCFFAEGFPG